MNYESRSSCMCVLGSNIGFFAKNDEETEMKKRGRTTCRTDLTHEKPSSCLHAPLYLLLLLILLSARSFAAVLSLPIRL